MQPTLILQTVHFHESDREAAFELGTSLYRLLTRPPGKHLAFGPGIPVFCAVAPDRIDMEAAEIVLVIPVLGKTAFTTGYEPILEVWKRWHLGRGNGLVFPVLTSENWRSVENRMPGTPCLTELYETGDRRRATIDEIVLAATRLLDGDAAPPTLFVSHAKGDLDATGRTAERIRDYVNNNTTGRAFFDRTCVLTGNPLAEQIDRAAGRGVFLSVRSDQYSDRVWCQHEMLTAKRKGIPILSVEVLKEGERRSSPYGGNSPTLVWREDAAAVASAAMVEWLRDAHFKREAVRIRRQAELPEPLVVSRPPELLDLAQGPVARGGTQFVFYPDPELPVFEREILQTVHPRLHLATPNTVFRQLLGSTRKRPFGSPLQGLQVALSLSKSSDVGGPDGFTEDHVVDATIRLARTLLSAGAAIAYGGNFRHGGYTNPLGELVAAYNQTASEPADFLHSYLAATIPAGEAPAWPPLKIHEMAKSEDALLPPPEGEEHPKGLYFSDMRRVMAQKTHARIAIGGQTQPQTAPGADGYVGRYPGIVEEAWRALQIGQPLYVVGGFGGASALVADLLEGKSTPEPLKDQTWWSSTTYRTTAQAIDADHYRERLELPRRLEDLAEEVRGLGRERLHSAKEWNGLTEEENRILFRTRDTVTIANLIMRGLLEVTRRRAEGRLEIELIQGSITGAAGLDCLAVATFDDLELGGAGLAIDRAMGGLLSVGKTDGVRLIGLDSGVIDAEWVYLASLGSFQGLDKSKASERVGRAAHETARMAERLGMRRLGVVAFAGGVLAEQLATVADEMVTALFQLAGKASVSWFEEDERRFDALRRLLEARSEARSDIKLTTRKPTVDVPLPSPREEPLILATERSEGKLSITVLPPSGTTSVGSNVVGLSDKDLKRYSSGFERDGLATPDLSTLKKRGRQLAQLLLGDEANDFLRACGSAPIVVVHDLASARLPFETLVSVVDREKIPPEDPTKGAPVAVTTGITRRLKLPGVSVKRLFARPARIDSFDALLVCNPTLNLPKSKAECACVRAFLEAQRGVKVTVLCESEATKERFVEEVSRCDVLHYCGHGFYKHSGPDGSGLLLYGSERLTLRDLEGVTLPRMAFVNACYAAQLAEALKPGSQEAASFAEFFLAGGVEVYLGTFWRVDDQVAGEFACHVYQRLAEGGTLQEAVVAARAALLREGKRDWANYLLYGDGRLRLVRPA